MTVSTTKHARNRLLASRVWSRGITASYAYDALGQLTNVHYSGNTPDVSFAYNRLGRMVSAITAVSSHLFEYAGLDLAGEIQDGVAITRSYDGLGRSTGFNMGDTYSAAYGYDDFGRFCSVSSSVCSVCSLVNYSRLPGTDLVASMTNSAGFWWQRTYEQNRNLISAVSNHVNHVNPVLISAYDYANDSAGRRVSRNADSFGYNARSEVIGAVIGTNSYGYAHDAIGNRVFSAVNAVTNTYTANSLNQYTAVTPPIAVAYDADGNMTYYGDWYHTWDAENRLTGSQPAGFATNGAIRLEYVYNHKNLRVAKIKKQLSGRGADYPFNPLQPGTWDAIETRRYVWDGYNIAAEIVIDEVTPSTNVTYYTWGLDLSGTLQGAGGVGGLLAVVRSDGTFFPCYDANGNVTDYVDGSGEIRAHYEYSPFGETIAQSGDLADTFTHRFSTKPFDAETSLVMYQLRPYAPGLGRWMSRDPIGEKGGKNLYRYVGNEPISRIDLLGREEFTSITMKRKHVKWLVILKEKLGKKSSGEDTYGHWWMEFDGESYGWWPKDPLGLVDTLVGVPGELNGQTSFGGTSTTDPHHGDSAEESFHPKRRDRGELEAGEIVGGTPCKCATVDEIKQCLRAYAGVYGGSWSYPWGQNCHSFQNSAMRACCLKK